MAAGSLSAPNRIYRAAQGREAREEGPKKEAELVSASGSSYCTFVRSFWTASSC